MQNKKRQSVKKTKQQSDLRTTQIVRALLHDLEQLHMKGIVSDDEFESGKSKLLDSL